MALLSTDRLDRLLDVNGDITIGRSANGMAGVAQRIQIRLRLFRGEWFLNQDTGIPYFQKLLGHKFRPVAAQSIFRSEILKVQGVIEVRSLTVSLSKQRTLLVDFNVRTEFGDLASSVNIEGG